MATALRSGQGKNSKLIVVLIIVLCILLAGLVIKNSRDDASFKPTETSPPATPSYDSDTMITPEQTTDGLMRGTDMPPTQ